MLATCFASVGYNSSSQSETKEEPVAIGGRIVTEYAEVDGQIVDAATGEVLPDLPDDITASFLAQRRYFVHQTKMYWERQLKTIDQRLIQMQLQERAVYDWIVISKHSSTVRHFDGEAFANMVYERYQGAMDLLPGPAKMNLLCILAAAKDYDPEKLSPFVLQDYRDACAEERSATWLKSAVTPMRAPKVKETS